MTITEIERDRLARALCDLQFDGTETDEEHNAKITAVIGHLELDDAKEVMDEWHALFTAEHEKWEEFYKLRDALFAGYPPGTTYGEIVRDLKKKGIRPEDLSAPGNG